MKSYQKPKLNLQQLSANEKMASLNDWLSENGLTNAGITTYLINS